MRKYWLMLIASCTVGSTAFSGMYFVRWQTD